jgi:hypothetical protein
MVMCGKKVERKPEFKWSFQQLTNLQQSSKLPIGFFPLFETSGVSNNSLFV